MNLKKEEVKINPYRLKKEDLIKFFVGRCEHRHLYNEHPSCFVKDKNINLKTGYLDIETNGLYPYFSVIGSYAIKEEGTNKIYGRYITPKELHSDTFDKEIIKDCTKDMLRFDRIITYYGCLTPSQKVLTSDLRYIPVGDIKINDELLAFDEFPVSYTKNNDKQTFRRHFKTTKVLANDIMFMDVYKLIFSDDTSIEATLDHPFLVRQTLKPGGYGWQWKNMFELKVGDTMHRLVPIWNINDTYESGFLSGFFDGEGSITHATKKRKSSNDFSFSVTASQNIKKNYNVVMKAKQCLDTLGFKYGIYNYDKNAPDQVSIRITGGKGECLKFLGMVRPSKIINQFKANKIGSIKRFFEEEVKIIEKIFLGKKAIIALGTDSYTYISEGFGSHNTFFDIPYLRTASLEHKIDEFPSYGIVKHVDVYFMVKNKLRLHRKSLQEVARVLGIEGKTHVDGHLWKKAFLHCDEKCFKEIFEHNKADVIVLEKVFKRLENYSAEVRKSI